VCGFRLIFENFDKNLSFSKSLYQSAKPYYQVETSTPPFYQKLSLTLLAIGIIMVAIYLGQDIIVPLALAGLLAVLLRPLEWWLMRIGIPKLISITLALTIAILIVSAVAVLISMQVADFSDECPKLKRNIDHFYRDARQRDCRECFFQFRQ